MTATVLRMRACDVDALTDQTALRLDPPGHTPIALFRLGDDFFATDDTCTHGAASLADGFVEDGQVECPFHSGRFDIRTGEATLYPCTVKLRIYPVEIDGGAVFIRLPSAGDAS